MAPTLLQTPAPLAVRRALSRFAQVLSWLNYPSAQTLDDRRCTPPRQDSNDYVNAKNARDEHQRAGPSLTMPVVIGRDRIGKNLQWKRSDRLAKVVIPKPVAESSKKKGRCFAAYAGQREQNSGDDSPGRSLHHNMY